MTGRISTFAHTEYLHCFGRDRHETFDIAFLGLPFDTLTSYRPGARFGPNGIRRGSQTMAGHTGYSMQSKVSVLNAIPYGRSTRFKVGLDWSIAEISQYPTPLNLIDIKDNSIQQRRSTQTNGFRPQKPPTPSHPFQHLQPPPNPVHGRRSLRRPPHSAIHFLSARAGCSVTF